MKKQSTPLKGFRIVGLYSEGNIMPRIEYRLMLGKKNLTDYYDIQKELCEMLGNLIVRK